MNQEQVKDVYLRVIDATLEAVRNEITEKGASEAKLESLEVLKSRWADRLTQTHEFIDDPELRDRPSGSAAKAKKAQKNQKRKGAPSGGPAPKTRNGVMSVADLTNPSDSDPVKPEPQLQTKQEGALVRPAETKPDGEPPAKRPRPDPEDDGEVIHGAEDLDSSDDDSDVKGGDEDEECENLVLAQHDRVKKGPKWKVILREGIISIRGREYLFNKATCDLEF